jgi:hypothetical protein
LGQYYLTLILFYSSQLNYESGTDSEISIQQQHQTGVVKAHIEPARRSFKRAKNAAKKLAGKSDKIQPQGGAKSVQKEPAIAPIYVADNTEELQVREICFFYLKMSSRS